MLSTNLLMLAVLAVTRAVGGERPERLARRLPAFLGRRDLAELGILAQRGSAGAFWDAGF